MMGDDAAMHISKAYTHTRTYTLKHTVAHRDSAYELSYMRQTQNTIYRCDKNFRDTR